MNTHEVKIQGSVFSVPLRYAQGHVLTDGEASALNQTFCENVRNNVAPRIKKEQDEGKAVDQEVWQQKVTEYAQSYEFGVHAIQTRLDPLDAEIKRIALSTVKEALRAGIASKNPNFTGKAKDYQDQLEGWANDLINHPQKGPAVRKMAERNLKDKRSVAASLFESITTQSAAA